jgi:uroporphyrinogen decarboxylase
MPTPTRKERVIAALNYKETDIVPTNMVIEGDVADRLNAHYGGTDWEKTVHNHLGFAAYPYWARLDTTEDGLIKDEYGSVWDFSRQPFHLVDFPLKEPSIGDYDFEAVTQVVYDSLDKEGAQKIIAEKSDRFVVGLFYFGLFERSWMLRGFENVLVDSILNQAFYEELLDRILEMQLRLVDQLLELPIDGVYLGDDWGDQRGVILGPDRWRHFIKPRAAKLYERIRSADKFVLTHCCGNVMDIIPDMIEMGLDVLESLQPEAMDVYEIKRKYGKDLRLWGGLGTQHVLPFGSPQEVRDEIRHLIEELGGGGGYILAPAKPLMEDIPTANAVAVIEEFAQGL